MESTQGVGKIKRKKGKSTEKSTEYNRKSTHSKARGRERET